MLDTVKDGEKKRSETKYAYIKHFANANGQHLVFPTIRLHCTYIQYAGDGDGGERNENGGRNRARENESERKFFGFFW